MSQYGLIKATSRIMREDTIHDLYVINKWRLSNGRMPFTSPKPSVRQLENTAVLAIANLELSDLPKLWRSIEFYISILKEIKPKEKQAIVKLNKIKK